MKVFSEKKLILVGVSLAIILILIIMVGFPILTNSLMFKGDYRIAGDHSTWIGFLGTFWGAIVGGVISGSITLIGVWLTIKSSIHSKEEDLIIEATKERLNKLYHPVDSVLNIYAFNYGAHNFTDLSFDEQKKLLTLLGENILYADSELYILIIEMQWTFKEKDDEYLNGRYQMMSDLISETMEQLRKQLKLPTLE